MTTARATTNLAMAMRLPATDPHSILHANIWARPEREPAYLQTEKLETPVEGHLDQVEESSYEVLDLGAEAAILPDEGSRMLVRDDYEELHQMIEKDRHTPGRHLGGMVVTGNPGIGKSFFLFYYLFKNLIAAQPTALQTEKNSFLLFIEDGVYLIRFSSNTAIYDIQSQLRNLGCKKGIVALVDTSEKIPSPAHVFTDSRFPFYIVQATAPRASNWTNWLGQRSGSIVVMKPYTWSEIFIIGMNFCIREFTANDLFHVFYEYGPNVRLCLDLAGDERRIKLYDLELRVRTPAFPDFTKAAQSYRFFSNAEQRLESILLLIPDASRLPLVTITSLPIALHFAKSWGIIRFLELEAGTRNTGQNIWEILANDRFLTNHNSIDFTYTRIGPSTTNNYDIRCSVTTAGCPLSSLPTDTRFQRNVLWNCADLGIETCCAVTTDDWYTLIFRVCRDPEATINVEELDLLDRKLRGFENWDSRRSWRFIWLVPPGMEYSFTTRPFVGDSKNKGEWESEGKIVQYVAGFNI